MLDSVYGDSDSVSPIVLAMIAIVVAVLLFGGCRIGDECSDCCTDKTLQSMD